MLLQLHPLTCCTLIGKRIISVPWGPQQSMSNICFSPNYFLLAYLCVPGRFMPQIYQHRVARVRRCGNLPQCSHGRCSCLKVSWTWHVRGRWLRILHWNCKNKALCGSMAWPPKHIVKRQNTYKSNTHLTCPRRIFCSQLHDRIKFYFPICRGCEQRRYSRVLPSCRNHNGQKRVSPVLVCSSVWTLKQSSEGHLSRRLFFLGDTEQPQWAQECS